MFLRQSLAYQTDDFDKYITMTSQVDPNVSSSQLMELAVTNLGVIENVSLLFNSGMTVITGETGAGKTLLVTALQLLSGGRSDSSLVGVFGDEAIVEGRFLSDGNEIVLERIIPKEGRSRAYFNGRISTVGFLQEFSGPIVEIHGQHGYSGLVHKEHQRKALDDFASIDTSQLRQFREEESDLLATLQELGGSREDRSKELELYKFQASEIDEAEIVDALEDERLRVEELLLGDATGNREAAIQVTQILATNSRFSDEISEALRQIKGRESMNELERKINDLIEVVAEVASDARSIGESIDVNPEKLSQVQLRRSLLTSLRRKYGETIEEVLLYRDDLQKKIEIIAGSTEKIQETEQLLAELHEEIVKEEEKIAAQRREAAPKLSKQIRSHLKGLSLPHAVIKFSIEGRSGEDVDLLVALNKGMPVQPLSKIASGGELSRTMLALRLVLSNNPSTAIFDEVDAGIGGEVALSVGSALKRLAKDRQVLVVTHLAQVAAFADTHIGVSKAETKTGVKVRVGQLDDDQRVVEISRMLSGSPESEKAHKHALELLSSSRIDP